MEFSEVKLKKILKGERQEYQRYLGVVAEDFSDKLKLIAESVSGVQKQLVALRDMVVKNTEDIAVIKMDIESIKHMLKKKVDFDEFATLERRVSLLEKRR
ncbi:hypothetical protein A3B19_00260 [Candidatus Giovannonibacteria bacterium RIFCSPLOWO2_01_FULL_46_32]|uniref:Uncharacterized protein n=1 Tax=Candidatus Giovannonibacteria bacterium RIFCSPLOWO2_01_FULL_46_32 TaxID=1798353 RepID=A0A1F5XFP4_9BACT|nr:MAG: hypothetical protein A3B19_00260 [Candidatus Giovannonibacteria bacterium RIFCSPLOWO2_01_FULL_46_32]